MRPSPTSPRALRAPRAAQRADALRPAATLAAVAALLVALAPARPLHAQGGAWGKKLKEIARRQAEEQVERRVAEEAAKGAGTAVDRTVTTAKCQLAGACAPRRPATDSAAATPVAPVDSAPIAAAPAATPPVADTARRAGRTPR